MKVKSLLVLAIFFCVDSRAHSLFPTDLNEEEQRQMTETLRQLQACFANIDRGEIEELQQRSNRLASELRSLCFKGRRDEAEKKSLAFYDTMMGIDTVKQVKLCGDKIPPSFKSTLSTPLDLSQFEKREGRHICDREIMPVDQYSGHPH